MITNEKLDSYIVMAETPFGVFGPTTIGNALRELVAEVKFLYEKEEDRKNDEYEHWSRDGDN